MDKKAALEKIQRLSVAEKMAQFSETDMAYVEECIEQTISQEQQQSARQNAAPEHNE